MNLNISAESPIISMEQPSRSLTLTMENQVITVPQSEHTILPQILLPTSQTGKNELNPISNPSEQISPSKNAINSANQLLSLKSNVKPHALLEKPPELKILKVNKSDIKALCQVISEFQEQFINY
jgi:hypothetical protein